jgi:photosystem II stability/assembly factor-like uncharacterized protein
VSALDGAGDLHAVASDPGGHLVLAADARGAIFSSDDRGATFAREGAAAVGLDAIALRDDGAMAIAAGQAGAVLVRDARGTWTRARAATIANLHAALVEDDRAYVAGDDGALLEATAAEADFRQVGGAPTSATLWALEDL